MKLKKLLVSIICTVFVIGTITGCGKEEATGNQVVSEAPTSETSVSEAPEVSADAGEETSADAEMKAEAIIDPDDIKLRNPFMEAYADTVIVPAEPDMTFDADVKMNLNQLTTIVMGKVSANLGEFTTEDIIAVGYIDAFGKEASIDESFKMITAGAKGYTFEAYYDENVINRILVLNGNLEEDSDKNAPEIPMKFTAFGVQVGEKAETLKQLGVPALVAQIDEEMNYYWQIETEDGGCCLRVKAVENIITGIEIMIF